MPRSTNFTNLPVEDYYKYSNLELPSVGEVMDRCTNYNINLFNEDVEKAQISLGTLKQLLKDISQIVKDKKDTTSQEI